MTDLTAFYCPIIPQFCVLKGVFCFLSYRKTNLQARSESLRLIKNSLRAL